MPLDKKFNLVSFTPDGGERIFLQLEGEFVLSAGVAPNVNRAIVPFGEFDKLQNKDGIADLGTIEFWFSSSPEDGGEPDHKIAGVRIVDAEPVELGIPRGQEESRIIEYRLILADMRERFVGWRGGILTDGEINAMTSPPANIRDNFRLVHDCLDAMGATFEISGGVIGDLRKSMPMGDLTWAASSAPEELAKLLDYCRAALVVSSTAKLEVVTMGTGDDPQIPAGREVPGLLKMPGRGRRGKTIVFTSAPNPVIETLTMLAPDPTTWQFVARDAISNNGETERPWTALGDVRLLASKGPVQTLKDDFKDAGKDREALRTDVYHYLRLSKFTKDPRVAKVLRVLRHKASWGEPEVSAKVAQQQDDGTWKNSTELVNLGFAHLDLDPISGEPIIHVNQLMGQVDPDRADSLQKNFKALTTKGDIAVRCSIYAVTKDNKHEFFTIGFSKTPAGDLQQLSAKEVDALIAKTDKDVTFIAIKEFQLHRIDGEEQNRDELTKYAKDMAELFLRGSEAEYQQRTAAGFVAAELSGKVTEIRWDQKECKTTLKVNAWAYPLYIAGVRERLKAGGGQIFPSQNQTASSRLAIGGVGAGQSSVPVLPGAPAPPPAGGSMPAGKEQFTQWTTVVPNFADWDFDRATP